VGRYRIDTYLGGGGMADVYGAVTAGAGGFEKRVAIKVVNDALSNLEQFQEMLLDEAWMAAQVQHPNVCQVLDAGVSDGRSFVVLEHLGGHSLREVLTGLSARAQSSFDSRHLAIAAKLIGDVLLGVHAAHTARDLDGRPMGIIHHDISPDNVFICGRSGAVKLLDFGVATSDRRARMQRHTLVGKLAYAAPERVELSPAVDHRADLWSVGVLLWELLTATRLFRCSTPEHTRAAITTCLLPRPSMVRPKLPSVAEPVIARALCRDPEDRYATALDMAQALSALAVIDRRAVTSTDVARWAAAAMA